ncbi:MAG: sugar phosphate isomerase/epimerase, partial [Flavitalea sp.]
MLNRRQLLEVFSVSAVSPLIPFSANSEIAQASAAHSKYTYCLNMATLRGHKLGFIKELDVAAKAGFRSVEIWIDTLQVFLAAGGSVA